MTLSPTMQMTRPEQQLLSLVAFSDDLDRMLACLTMAIGAAASNVTVHVFFTFWATSALRQRPLWEDATWLERIATWFLPSGPEGLKLSKRHYGGLGTVLMRRRMRRKGVADVRELIEMAADLGVHFHVCEMSMDLLGMSVDDLIDYPHLEVCGVATLTDLAMSGQANMFI